MTCNLYNMDKRQESTKIPPDGSGYATNVALKLPTTMESPNLIFSDPNVTQYNYMFLDGRYYWLGKWGYLAGSTFTNTGIMDTLGTYRAHIMDNEQFVERSNILFDDTIIDNQYPSTTTMLQRRLRNSMGFDSAGSYIVGVAGASGVKYYNMLEATFVQLMDFLYTEPQDNLWDTIVDFATTNLVQTFVDLLQYIVSVKWIPYTLMGNAEYITAGYWNTGVVAWLIPPEYRMTRVMPVSFPDMWSGHESFLNHKPYTEMTLFVPGAGTFDIDPDMVTGTNTAGEKVITTSIDVDRDGRMLGTVESGDNMLFRFEGYLGVEIPLTANGIDLFSVLNSALSIGSSVASGFGGSPTAGLSLTGNVASAIQSVIPKIRINGGQGSYSLFNIYPDLWVEMWHKQITPLAPDKFGYPYMRMAPLNQTGYYKINKPRVEFGNYNEKQEIINYMEGGFWVE